MKTAILGFGTVGVGVWEMLEKAQGLQRGAVLVRQGKETEPFQVSSMEEILRDASMEAVVEVMGGTEAAYDYARETLRSGRHLITANKALVAAHGLELSALARERGAAFLFSAACGGGVPFLSNLSAAARTDTLLSVGGILNGTTNYILDAMQRRGLDFAQALGEAQALGYAESDPTADISGLDTLRKLVLACAVGFGRMPTGGFAREGIENVTAEDVAAIREKGLTCRLVARGGVTEKGVYALVQPTLFPADAPECAVLSNYNLARYTGERCGPMVLMGQGAGRYPTASAVLRDLRAVAEGEREMLPAGCQAVEADNSAVRCRYFLRLSGGGQRLPELEDREERNGTVQGFLPDIPVSGMHALANQIRKEGGRIFFAAVGE